jgi:hypothetical protein
MVTYLYWGLAFGLAAAAIFVIGIRMDRWFPASAISITILTVASLAYYFHFQQIFVKHWGGVMSIKVPTGQHHMGATWKDDNLWIENYDPASNTCIFTEYSKGNLLQGKVMIKDCDPLMP